MKIRSRSKVEQEKERIDLGFGTKATSANARLVRSDGIFNVKKLGQSFLSKLNIYHSLIVMSWSKFFLVVFAFYFFTNIIFGFIYYQIGSEGLAGLESDLKMSKFWNSFFFSAQTLTTVGYGRVSPANYLSSFVSSIEAFIGLMIFAIMTGLLYGRFSRPVPRIIFSENALIAPYLDGKALMFRMANERNNQLLDVTVEIVLARNEIINGEVKRKYYNLELERKKVKYFALSWTIVHPITPDSALFNETEESIRESLSEFLVSISAINDTQSDPVNTRKSYLFDQLVYGAKFVPITQEMDDQYVLDLNKIGTYDLVEI